MAYVTVTELLCVHEHVVYKLRTSYPTNCLNNEVFLNKNSVNASTGNTLRPDCKDHSVRPNAVYVNNGFFVRIIQNI
jgi:hypothetical protein